MRGVSVYKAFLFIGYASVSAIVVVHYVEGPKTFPFLFFPVGGPP